MSLSWEEAQEEGPEVPDGEEVAGMRQAGRDGDALGWA